MLFFDRDFTALYPTKKGSPRARVHMHPSTVEITVNLQASFRSRRQENRWKRIFSYRSEMLGDTFQNNYLFFYTLKNGYLKQ